MKNIDVFSAYLKNVSKIPMMSKSEEIETGKLACAGDKNAQKKLVETNLRFVIKIAKKYQNRGLELEDLVNEGNSGLIHAAEKFNPEKNTKFITYASYWIRFYIEKSIYDMGRTVKIPVGNKDALSDEKWKAASLESEIQNDGNSSSKFLGQIISDELAENPEEKTIQNEEENQLKKAVFSLKKAERYIIISRFGLFGSEQKSFAEIGKIVGLSKERVRQIQNASIEKLKRKLAA